LDIPSYYMQVFGSHATNTTLCVRHRHFYNLIQPGCMTTLLIRY